MALHSYGPRGRAARAFPRIISRVIDIVQSQFHRQLLATTADRGTAPMYLKSIGYRVWKSIDALQALSELTSPIISKKDLSDY